jgi:MFS family permease
MIRAAGPTRPDTPPDSPSESVYGRSFWLSYAANTTLMFTLGLMFRYADFIKHLGGGELELGLIVGVGMVGAIAMRLFQGVTIDRYGPRLIWTSSLVLFALSLAGHLAVTDVNSPAIYLLRLTMTVGLAGAFGASITYVSLTVPTQRIAEIVGTLGSSGFVGIALGPVVGDWMFDTAEVTRWHIDRMFLTGAVLGGLSLVLAILATSGQTPRARRQQPGLIPLVRRYHPGPLLLVAAAMGIGIALPHTFLRTYLEHLDIKHMKTFFVTYAVTAFVVRIASRRLPQRIGLRPMILLGLGFLSLSMLLYLTVRTESMLVVPALAGGIAHAFLFPSVVAGGSLAFPTRYRGLATTLVLAMFDIGNLIGQPMVGGIINYAPQFELPGYGTMFVTVATGLIVVAAYYVIATRHDEENLAEEVMEDSTAVEPVGVEV